MARLALLSFGAALVAFFALAGPAAQAVTISTVPVGNPGNAADNTGFGAVGYAYRIGVTEVTNAQYAEFLNAVAASDPYQLFPNIPSQWFGINRSGSPGSFTYAVKAPVPGEGLGGAAYNYDDKPITQATWLSAIRFTNWLHNGQGNGDTETGAYTLLGGTAYPTNALTVARNPGARWVLPSENEWYKAAYYNGASGVYYDYATQSNSVPNNNQPASDTGNSANFLVPNPPAPSHTTGDPQYPFTPVGAYGNSESFYATFDQSGNVAEWMESHQSPFSSRVIRGGSASDTAMFLPASSRNSGPEASGFPFTGFRVALVPEPGSALLAGIVAMALAAHRHR
jgi:sulfatase modifying factor 1